MSNGGHAAEKTSHSETLRPILKEARVRLFALARSIDGFTVDATEIRRTAVALERVVQRVHWVADMAGDEALGNSS